MLRFIKLLAITALLTGLFAGFVAPTKVMAKIPDGEDPTATCIDPYNGKTFVVGKDKAKAYNKSGCDGSYCSTKDTTVTSDNNKKVKAIKITCKAVTTTSPCGETDCGNTGTDTNAGQTDPAIDYAEGNCDKSACNIIPKIINPLIATLTVLVGLAVVVGIIFGAIQIITSAGDPQKAASGRNHIRNALIAVVAYILLYGFLSFIIPGGIN